MTVLIVGADQQALFRENQAYLPYLGLYALSGMGVYKLSHHISKRKVLSIIGVLVVAAWGCLLVLISFQRLRMTTMHITIVEIIGR
jgi:hypothetical protein